MYTNLVLIYHSGPGLVFLYVLIGQPSIQEVYDMYKVYRKPERLFIGRSLVQQWAKYRYGVFDEVGYKSDPVYPTCYQGDRGHSQVTGCSDLPIQDMG
jgi:hypothetical protein